MKTIVIENNTELEILYTVLFERISKINHLLLEPLVLNDVEYAENLIRQRTNLENLCSQLL